MTVHRRLFLTNSTGQLAELIRRFEMFPYRVIPLQGISRIPTLVAVSKLLALENDSSFFLYFLEGIAQDTDSAQDPWNEALRDI